jgi:O-antigen/teichoic acid export membrane protein
MLVLESTVVFVHLPGVAFVREFSAEERAEAIATVAAIKLLLCIPACAFMIVVAGLVESVFFVPATMVRLLAIVPPITAVSSIAVMVFESRRDMVRRNLPVISEAAGRLGVLLVVLGGFFAMPSRVETMALVWGVGTLPSLAVALLLHGVPSLKAAHLGKARAYFSFGWRTTAAQFIQKQLMWVGTAAVYLAFLPVSVALAQQESGLFKIAFSLMFYIVLFGTTIGIMVYPMMSRAFAHPDEPGRFEEAHRLLSLAFYYELILSVPIAVSLAILAPSAFDFLLPGFGAAAPIARSLAFVGVLLAASLPAIMLMPAANRPDLTLRIFLLMAAVAVGVNAALVPQVGQPWGGVNGAIIADWATALAGFVYSYRLVAKLGVRLPSYATFRTVLAERTAAPVPPT